MENVAYPKVMLWAIPKHQKQCTNFPLTKSEGRIKGFNKIVRHKIGYAIKSASLSRKYVFIVITFVTPKVVLFPHYKIWVLLIHNLRFGL